MPPTVAIRRALPGEASLLTDLAHAAKRHWGYPDAWMAEWRDALTMTPELIASLGVFVAESRTVGILPGVVGFHALSVCASASPTGVLEHLWVHPSNIGQGVGRALLAHAVEQARGAGCTELQVDSDPNAEGFYLRAGARRVAEVRADVGGTVRMLPRLLLTL